MEFLLSHIEGIVTGASILVATVTAFFQSQRLKRVKQEEFTLQTLSFLITAEGLRQAFIRVNRDSFRGEDPLLAIDDEDIFAAYSTLLDFYTDLAISVKNGLLVEEIVLNNMGSAMLRHFDYLAPYIQEMRTRYDFPRYVGTYEEFVENRLRRVKKRFSQGPRVKK